MTNLPLTLQQWPTIVVTDTNLQSLRWVPIYSDTYKKGAGDVIDIMARWDLKPRWLVGKPTCCLKSTTTTRGTTIDLVWVNEKLDNVIKTYLINTVW